MPASRPTMSSLPNYPLWKWSESKTPTGFEGALKDAPDALQIWDSTTVVAPLDWVHWIVSAKQSKTREKRIHDACNMLAKGKNRVCCFDPSGYFSKAFKAPK